MNESGEGWQGLFDGVDEDDFLSVFRTPEVTPEDSADEPAESLFTITDVPVSTPQEDLDPQPQQLESQHVQAAEPESSDKPEQEDAADSEEPITSHAAQDTSFMPDGLTSVTFPNSNLRPILIMQRSAIPDTPSRGAPIADDSGESIPWKRDPEIITPPKLRTLEDDEPEELDEEFDEYDDDEDEGDYFTDEVEVITPQKPRRRKRRKRKVVLSASVLAAAIAGGGYWYNQQPHETKTTASAPAHTAPPLPGIGAPPATTPPGTVAQTPGTQPSSPGTTVPKPPETAPGAEPETAVKPTKFEPVPEMLTVMDLYKNTLSENWAMYQAVSQDPNIQGRVTPQVLAAIDLQFSGSKELSVLNGEKLTDPNPYLGYQIGTPDPNTGVIDKQSHLLAAAQLFIDRANTYYDVDVQANMSYEDLGKALAAFLYGDRLGEKAKAKIGRYMDWFELPVIVAGLTETTTLGFSPYGEEVEEMTTDPATGETVIDRSKSWGEYETKSQNYRGYAEPSTYGMISAIIILKDFTPAAA